MERVTLGWLAGVNAIGRITIVHLSLSLLNRLFCTNSYDHTHVLSFTTCRDRLANPPRPAARESVPWIDSQGLLGKKAGVELLPRNLARPSLSGCIARASSSTLSLPLTSPSSYRFHLRSSKTNRPCSPIIILVTGLRNQYSTGPLCSSDTSSASTLHASSVSRIKKHIL
jgi:hypothetical protein